MVPSPLRVLMEGGLKRLQRAAAPRYDSPCGIRDHVAAAVGAPDRVLITPRQMQRYVITSAGDLLCPDERPAPELTSGHGVPPYLNSGPVPLPTGLKK